MEKGSESMFCFCGTRQPHLSPEDHPGTPHRHTHPPKCAYILNTHDCSAPVRDGSGSQSGLTKDELEYSTDVVLTIL